MALATGSRLGQFEIVSPLGVGGMGEVYRARDPRLGRDVAIKVLREALSRDAERLSRFDREARSLAALNHPNIGAIYGIEEEGGTRFLVLELVPGDTLAKKLRPGAMPIEEGLKICAQIAAALEAAHGAGLIHRDLKPSNVMLTPEGRVKVLDFGLAKATERGDDSPDSELATATEATAEGSIVGTAAYMSPEQARGKEVDKRTDVWAFGCVLFEVLTGKRAFPGETTPDRLAAVLASEPEWKALPEDTPVTVRSLLRRCLQKKVDRRLRDIGDARIEIEDSLGDLSSTGNAATTQRAHAPAVSTARRPTWLLGAVLVIGVAGYLATRTGVLDPPSRGPEAGSEPHVIRSIAVLPLDNYSGDPAQDYFAEGMTDELTADLATISRLRVISRGSASQFRGKQRPPTPEIAEALDVDAIVEGSVVRVGDRVRITAQLIDARADRHLWARSFERDSRDVLALQAELAAAIAREIHVQLTPAEQSRLSDAPSVNPVAFDAYLKGRYYFNRPNDENLTRAIARFEEAIDLDPDYAPAFSGLSDAYTWAGYNEGVLTASEARPKARAAAQQAIELDDESAEAHTSLAVFKLFYEYDWAGCEIEFRRAFALNPNYAFAHDQFGLGLAFQGRFDESIAESKRASALDPLSPQIPIDATLGLAMNGDYRAAKEQAKRAAELDPTFFFPPWAYGWIDIQAGKVDDAIPEFRKAKAMDSPAFVSAWLAYAYGASGDRARALAELEDLKQKSLRGSVTSFNLALVDLGLGDRARALGHLEEAYASDSQWLGWLKNDRTFDPLRAEPRFVALMKMLGFEK